MAGEALKANGIISETGDDDKAVNINTGGGNVYLGKAINGNEKKKKMTLR